MGLISAIKRLFGLNTMRPGDRLLTCMDCNNQFVFDEGEQRFFKTKGFTDPKRCPVCRKKIKKTISKKRRGGGGRKFRNGPKRNGNSLIDGDSPYADAR